MIYIHPKISRRFESLDMPITAGGSLTIGHELGVKPVLFNTYLKCIESENGYLAGDEVLINFGMEEASAQNAGKSIVFDSVNINVRFGSSGIVLANKTTGSAFNISVAKWKFRIDAWV